MSTPNHTSNVSKEVSYKVVKRMIAVSIRSAMSHLKAARNLCTDELRGTERDIGDELERLDDIIGALENGS